MKSTMSPTAEVVFVCESCGHQVMIPENDKMWIDCPRCLGEVTSKRRTTIGVNLTVPLHMQAQNEQGNAKQKAYMQTPEAREKLMSGEWRIEKNDY